MRALLVLGALVSALAVPAGAAAPVGVIVFSREVGGDGELFAIRPDGSGLRRITNDDFHEAEPVWSPDRRLLVSAGVGELLVRSASGRLLDRIPAPAEGTITEPRWSPGGRQIAFLVERCQSEINPDPSPLCADLWIVGRAGTAPRRLVEANVATNDLIASYAWSPNGGSIVFERFDPHALVVVNTRTGGFRSLPRTARGSDPRWGPTGWIAFARQRGPFRGSDLYAMRADGTGLRRLARARNAMRPAWAPGGRRVAFLDFSPRSGLNRWRVTVVRWDGTEQVVVGAATAEWTLVWSPDATRLLWENEGGRLLVAAADGSGRPRQLTRGSLADWR